MDKIALWKIAWLPATETFIREQQKSYKHYEPIALGLSRLDSPLAKNEDVLLNADGDMGKFKFFLLKNFGVCSRVKDYLKNNDIKLVHAHFANQGFSIAKIANQLNVPLVVSLHGHDINEAPYYKGLSGIKYRFQLRRLFRRADHFIAVSHAIRNRAIQLGCNPEKITVRYTGLNIDRETTDREKKWDIVFVGRLIDIKGPHHVLESAKIIREKSNRNIKIAFIGSGEREEELRALAKKYNLDIDFMGYQKSEKIQEVMESSRIFVGPSHRTKPNQQEGFGMVYLEAALAKIPSVAYVYGGVPEAVLHNETGLLAPEGNVEALASNILFLLENPPIAQKMGEAGYNRTRQNFDISRCTADIEELYEKIICNKVER